MEMSITPNDVPRDLLERRAWALKNLRRAGWPLKDLAAREGVDHSGLHRAFTRPSERMEFILAEALGLTPQQLFPERFSKDGRRIEISRPRGEWKEMRKAYLNV